MRKIYIVAVNYVLNAEKIELNSKCLDLISWKRGKNEQVEHGRVRRSRIDRSQTVETLVEL